MVGLWRLDLPTYGLGIQTAVMIGVENFRLYMQCQAVPGTGCQNQAQRNLLQWIVRVVSHVSDVVLNRVTDQGHRKGRLVEANKQLLRRLQPQRRSFLLIETNTVLE